MVVDQRHRDAVQSLDEARRRARSEEGRERFEALKRRARLLESGEERMDMEGSRGVDHLMMLPPPPVDTPQPS